MLRRKPEAFVIDGLVSPALTPKLSELKTTEERLLAVADAIENEELVKQGIGFHMNWFIQTSEKVREKDKTHNFCGTVACIAGWTTLLDDSQGSSIHRTSTGAVRDSSYLDAEERATEILDLDKEIAGALFFARRSNVALENITPKHAVAVIRHLAATGRVAWDCFDENGEPK